MGNDDRDALHQRNDALEKTIADQKREIEALKHGPAGERDMVRGAQRLASLDDSDPAIGDLVRRAWGAVGVFVLLASISLGATVASHTASLHLGSWLPGFLLAATALAGAGAVFVSGRPIRRRTGFDVDFMVARVWVPGFLGLLIPPVAIVDAFLRLGSSTIGGYQTTRENGLGGNSYPTVALPQGEGRPLGVALLTIATLWPAVVACAVFGQWIFQR